MLRAAEPPHGVEHLGFCARGWEFEEVIAADRRRHGLVEEIIEILGVDDLEHVLDVRLGRADVPLDEAVDELGEGRRHRAPETTAGEAPMRGGVGGDPNLSRRDPPRRAVRGGSPPC